MTKRKKAGRLTVEETTFITNNVRSMTLEDIAKKLNRRVESIQLYVNKEVKHIATKEIDKFDLKSRKYWDTIKRQFAPSELPLFEYHWTNIIKQFNKDVIYTEELQIIDVARLEILCNRALSAQQESANQIITLQAQLETLKSGNSNGTNDEEIFNMDRQIALLRTAQDTLSKDFKAHQDQKMKLLDKIKGSRDQRVSKIESHKETFPGLLLRLRKDPEFAEKVSLDMEKMRLSMKLHLAILGDYHEFADKMIDRCILNEETVFYEDKEDERT